MPEPELIVVADDDGDVRLLVHHALAGAGIEVIEAADGAEALAAALRHQPSCVVTDLSMPGMDGLALVRRLRGHEQTAAIPIVVVTGLRDDDVRLRAIRQIGDVTVVAKPFAPAELRATVTEIRCRPVRIATPTER